MSEQKPETKGTNKNTVIIAAIAAIAIMGGGFLYYKESQKKTVSLNVGGKNLSATFSK
jgi:hypothetical protein